MNDRVDGIFYENRRSDLSVFSQTAYISSILPLKWTNRITSSEWIEGETSSDILLLIDLYLNHLNILFLEFIET